MWRGRRNRVETGEADRVELPSTGKAPMVPSRHSFCQLSSVRLPPISVVLLIRTEPQVVSSPQHPAPIYCYSGTKYLLMNGVSVLFSRVNSVPLLSLHPHLPQ